MLQITINVTIWEIYLGEDTYWEFIFTSIEKDYLEFELGMNLNRANDKNFKYYFSIQYHYCY